MCGIAVQKHLQLAFSPPRVAVGLRRDDADRGTQIAAAALDARKHPEVLADRRGALAMPVGMEVQRVWWRFAERDVDVVEDERDVFDGVVGQHDPRRSTERHRERCVERAALRAREERILEGNDRAEARAEEVAQRRSQNISSRRDRSISGERSFTVIQMRRMIPAPCTSASTSVPPAFSVSYGCPLAPPFSTPPPPGVPVLFSGLIHRGVIGWY